MAFGRESNSRTNRDIKCRSSERYQMIEWNTVRYIDCLDAKEGLPSLPDQSIDLCLTDPPYNVGYNGTIQDKSIRMLEKYQKWQIKNKYSFYNDKIENYEVWCRKWFAELKRTCKAIVFTCGTKNLKMWLNIEEPRGILIHYKRNCNGITSISRYNHWEPILVYGKVKGFCFRSNVFDIPLKSGFMKPHYEKPIIHPSPKEIELYQIIIERVKPLSVIDPFLGSGTTSEVCQRLGISWLGYEINEIYRQDIEHRLSRAKPIKRTAQQTLV